jgi:chromate transporter
VSHIFITLVELLWLFGRTGISAFGGITVTLPEMEAKSVEAYHWLSSSQFADAYALGQIVPGPGTTFVVAIGYRAAGILGGLVALFAIYAPAGALAYVAQGRWDALRNWRWHDGIQKGLTPVTTGLLLAAAYALLRATVHDAPEAVIAGLTTLLLIGRRANPAFLVLASGVVAIAVYR